MYLFWCSRGGLSQEIVDIEGYKQPDISRVDETLAVGIDDEWCNDNVDEDDNDNDAMIMLMKMTMIMMQW